MKAAVLGTGMVGRAHAEKLATLGHHVVMGTRNVEKIKANNQADQMGNPPFSDWYKNNGKIRLVTFAEAVAQGDVVFNALSGHEAVEILRGLASAISDKVVIDITNPLDFSKGMPPTLFVCNTDSLGEQIQKALPNAKVVKALNTLNATLQVNPKMLADGDHHVFVSGNDENAKRRVTQILASYGWEKVIDLGDITTARGTEMFLALWIRLYGSLKNPMFNIKIVK